MNLKEINESWDKSKKNPVLQNIEKVNQRIEGLKKEIVKTKRELEDLVTEEERALEDGDKTRADNAKEKRKGLIEKGKKLSADLKTLEESINKAQEKVNSHIGQLRANPELKAYIDECLGKKFQRQLDKAESNKEQSETLQKLIEKHSTFENNIIGMVNAQDDIIKLEAELKSLQEQDPGDAARIEEINKDLLPQAREKLKRNKSSIMNYVNKNNINITEEYLQEFIKEGSKGFRYFKDGKINIRKTLKNKIKADDKLIEKYERGLLKLGIPLNKQNQPQSKKATTSGSIAISTPKKPKSIANNKENLPVSPENPKWYQFIKRFKNWNEKRKAAKITNGAKDNKEKNVNATNSSKENFKDALKYDVVQEYIKQREEELTNSEVATKTTEQEEVARNVKKMMNGR